MAASLPCRSSPLAGSLRRPRREPHCCGRRTSKIGAGRRSKDTLECNGSGRRRRPDGRSIDLALRLAGFGRVLARHHTTFAEGGYADRASPLTRARRSSSLFFSFAAGFAERCTPMPMSGEVRAILGCLDRGDCDVDLGGGAELRPKRWESGRRRRDASPLRKACGGT